MENFKEVLKKGIVILCAAPVGLILGYVWFVDLYADALQVDDLVLFIGFWLFTPLYVFEICFLVKSLYDLLMVILNDLF